ncbi:hypothetical protein DYBT9275_00535 [Dyadobacter sp. CECT 9275]|uniref:Uncharacterized protein n=1 Tax=Dyadobacter helix TaxID=2822344 RepID=A0A916JAA4_9BACT|nr:hypothetical protein DYBT9275_00535 [Dyadobacter sp. CECT 9275]
MVYKNSLNKIIIPSSSDAEGYNIIERLRYHKLRRPYTLKL